MSNTIDKQLLSEKELQDMRMIAFNSYDDFSKYAAAKILQMYDHIEGLKRKVAILQSGAFDIPNEYEPLLKANIKLLAERDHLREALEKIRDRYAPEYGGHIGESEMREIARKALNTSVTAPTTRIETEVIGSPAGLGYNCTILRPVSEPSNTCIVCGKPFERDQYNVHCNDCGNKAEQEGAGMEYVEQVLEPEPSVDRVREDNRKSCPTFNAPAQFTCDCPYGECREGGNEG